MLYNVARLYYIDDMSQQQIANIIGVSRPQVSRMLQEARNRNIVDITLNPPFDISGETLTKRLKQILKIKKISIIEVDDVPEQDEEKRMDILSRFSASRLEELVKTSRRIGIGWGSTVYNTVLNLQYSHRSTDACFVPLVGSAGFSDPHYQTNSIVDRIAEKFKAQKAFLNAPAFLLDDAVIRYLKKTNNLDGQNSIWANLDAAFFSIGPPIKENVALSNAVMDQELRDRICEDSVTDLFGRFISPDGTFCLSEDECGCLSIPHNALLKIPERICAAIGHSKAEGLLIAAGMGIYNELITDSYTANAILKQYATK